MSRITVRRKRKRIKLKLNCTLHIKNGQRSSTVVLLEEQEPSVPEKFLVCRPFHFEFRYRHCCGEVFYRLNRPAGKAPAQIAFYLCRSARRNFIFTLTTQITSIGLESALFTKGDVKCASNLLETFLALALLIFITNQGRGFSTLLLMLSTRNNTQRWK